MPDRSAAVPHHEYCLNPVRAAIAKPMIIPARYQPVT